MSTVASNKKTNRGDHIKYPESRRKAPPIAIHVVALLGCEFVYLPAAAPGARIPCGDGLGGSSTRAHRLLLSCVAACCCYGCCHFQGIIGCFAVSVCVWWCENSWPIAAGGLASSIGGLCSRSPRDTNALQNPKHELKILGTVKKKKKKTSPTLV